MHINRAADGGNKLIDYFFIQLDFLIRFCIDFKLLSYYCYYYKFVDANM